MSLGRILGFAEFCVVYALATACGIGYAVRYLRNPNPRVSARLMRALGATVGSGTTLKGRLFLDNVWGDKNATGDFSHLVIGRNCFVGDGVFFDLAHEVVIEDDAVIAGGVSFLTHAECGRSRHLSRHFPRQCERVLVENGAWVGFGATVLAGVRIGRNTAVGAGSVLLEDAEEQCVYAGRPAKKIRSVR